MGRGIFLFEWRYHTRRLTFAVAAAFFTFFGFFLAAQAYTAEGVHLNAPYTIANALGLLSLVSVFVLMLFSAQALLRDGEYRMAEILWATSVTKGQFLFGRFAGSLAAAVTAMACALVGMVAGAWLMPHDAARLGAFDALDYLWSFAVLALPNFFLVAALLFAVAAWTRSTLATYVAGVFLYILYFVTALFTNSPLMAAASPPTPEGLAFAALVDPFGLSAVFEQTHYWSVAERNTRRLALTGSFLLNRVVWTAVGCLLLGVVYRLFAFRLREGGKGAAVDPQAGLPMAPGIRSIPGMRSARVTTRGWGWWRALVSTLRLEMALAVRGWPFAVLLILWVGILAMETFARFRTAEYGTVLLPTTGLLIGGLGEPLRVVGILLLVFYSAELVWRERAVQVEEIVDATPASSGVFLVAKTVALALLIGMLTLVAILLAIVFQLWSGTVVVDLGLYASLFYFAAAPLVLVAVLTVVFQVLSPNRYIGMLLSVGAFLVLFLGVGGLEEPLLRYGVVPEVPYSALNGFSPAAGSFAGFLAYWGSCAGLLLWLAYGLWRRGLDTGLVARLRALPGRWRGRSRAGATLFLTLLPVVTGGLLFHQTHRVNVYESSEALLDWKAAYEQRYRPLESLPQPTPVAIETAVDLYPSERRYRVRGRYELENRGEEPVATVWLAVRRDITRVTTLEVAGRSAPEVDARFGMYAFPLAEPLAPGGTTAMTFDLTVERRGATADGPDHGIVGNGSFLLSTFFLPTVGYRQSYELRDPEARRKRGLGEYARPTTLEGIDAGGGQEGQPRVRFETTISTTGDQTAMAPGGLVDQWEEGGRRFFHYRAEQPITPTFGFVSARYAVARARAGAVEVEVYYHPEHERNVDTYLRAAVTSLEYCSTQFGSYPHDSLRIVEIPAYWQQFAGLALPGMIYMVEDRGFLTDLSAPGRIDLVTKRIAHEVAHQWWGHQLVPANLPGGSALVETPARYTELMVLKEVYGEAAIPPALTVEMDRYLSGRGSGDEPALYDVGNQGYIAYAKGALVMLAMRDLIGEGAVNAAWASLLAAKPDPLDQATTRDLLEAFHRVAPVEHHALIDAWWREVVLYDLRIEATAVTTLPDGRFEVAAKIVAGKEAVRDGEMVSLPLDEVLEFALFAGHPNGRSDAANVLLADRRRVTGDGELTWVVDEVPGYIGIDPGLRRIDRNRVDNVRKVVAR